MILKRKITGPDGDRVLTVIRAAGGRPVLAGGCVRDAILHPGRPAKDIDIEVFGPADFERLAYALTEAGFAPGLTGVSFSVIKIRSSGTEFDIALARQDSKTGPGHRGFDVIPDGLLGFAAASARRDFTVNALMADPDTGEVTDCHHGLDDLRAGVLRHTSGAFTEDPLRVLRAVQFAARFGFRLHPETAALCGSISGAFTELAAERIWGEFIKLGTLGTDISAGLRVLAETGWERHFPPLGALHGVPQEPQWHPEGDVWTHSGLAAGQAARLADEAGVTGTDRLVLVLAALAHDFGKVTTTRTVKGRIISHGHAAAGVAPAVAFLRGAGCPHAIAARVATLVREHMNCAGRPSKTVVRRMARRLGGTSLTELALVIGADHAGRGDPGAPNPALAWLEMAAGLGVTGQPARRLLAGRHLIAAGMTPGPAFGPVLAAALTAQDDGEFTDEAGALAWLTQLTGRTAQTAQAREGNFS
jgi:tRNA nucleotidyltransferase (CCA-adding enzyme)